MKFQNFWCYFRTSFHWFRIASRCCFGNWIDRRVNVDFGGPGAREKDTPGSVLEDSVSYPSRGHYYEEHHQRRSTTRRAPPETTRPREVQRKGASPHRRPATNPTPSTPHPTKILKTLPNPAPPKILKRSKFAKFCKNFADPQNCCKIHQLAKASLQNSIFPVCEYKYYNPAKRNFAKGAKFCRFCNSF